MAFLPIREQPRKSPSWIGSRAFFTCYSSSYYIFMLPSSFLFISLDNITILLLNWVNIFVFHQSPVYIFTRTFYKTIVAFVFRLASLNLRRDFSGILQYMQSNGRKWKLTRPSLSTPMSLLFRYPCASCL